MFNDGSVLHKWNGRTQRENAHDYVILALCEQITYPVPDKITLCRRKPGGEWERVNNGT